MLSHLQLDHEVLARVDARIAREHEEKLYRPTAVPIVVSPKGNLLVVKSSKSHRWGPPQGGIESGERAIMGMFRELKEETGVDPSVARECGFCYTARLQAPGSRGFALGKSYYFFYVKCRTVPAVSLQTEEVDEYRWLEPHEVGDFLIGRAKLPKVRATLFALERAWRA